MRALILAGALALAAPAFAQTAQPQASEPPSQPPSGQAGGGTEARVPEVIRVDPPRLVTERTYGKQSGPNERWNDPIQVRKSFAPELQRSAQNLD